MIDNSSVNEVKPKKIKVKVCIPSYDGPLPRCLASIQSLEKFGGDYEFTAIEVRHAGIVQNRNTLSEDAEKYDYLLWVDDDIAFTHDNLKIAFAANKNVYNCAYQHQNTGKIVGTDLDWNENKGLILNPWVPYGFTLEKTSIYAGVDKPYFAMPPKEDGRVYSEDEWHCEKFQPEGVWLDTSNRVQHLPSKGLVTVKLEDNQWGNVIKAVITQPLPYIESHPLVESLRSQLKGQGKG